MNQSIQALRRGQGDRLEPGVGAERTQEVADVVAHRLAGEVEPVVADGDGADVGEDPPPVHVGDLELEVGRVLAVQLAQELLAGRAAVRRGDDVGEMPADNVACEGPCRRFTQRMIPGRSLA